MTAMELKCLKMELVEELLSIDDKDTLNRVKNYLKKLAGIDAGLKDMIAGRKQSARDFLKEMRDGI